MRKQSTKGAPGRTGDRGASRFVPRGVCLWAALLWAAGCGPDDAPTPAADAAPPAVFVEAGLGADGALPADAGSWDDATAEAGPDAASAVDAGPVRQSRVSLVDHDLWTRVNEADDPFGDRPASVYCVDMATKAEPLTGEPSYGVDTVDCNYVTVSEPSLVDVAAGEILEVSLAHFELTAPSNSEAHLSVRLGETTLLDKRVPIPSPAAVITERVVATEPVPAGTPVYFHVHNHGENSYALVSVSTGPAP